MMDSSHQQQFEDNLLTVTVFASLTAIVFSTIYFLFRIGFDNPPLPVIKSTGVASFLLCSPIIIRLALKRTYPSLTGVWFTSYGALLLVALLLCVGCGLLTTVLKIDFAALLTVLGLGSFLVTLLVWLAKGRLLPNLVFLLGTLIMAVWFATAIWEDVYHSTLYIEGLSKHFRIADTLYLATIVNLIKTYGYPSTGLHGAFFLSYHTGSHHIFAQLSRLIEIDALSFYQLSYPVIFIPLFLGAQLTVALEIRSTYKTIPPSRPLRSDLLFWLVFFAAQMGFRDPHNYYISESYMVGLTLLLLTLGLCIILFRQPEIQSYQFRRPSTFIFLLLVLPLLTFASGMSKITMIVALLGVCFYFLIRFRLFLYPLPLISATLLLIVFVITYRIGTGAVTEVSALGYPFEHLFRYYNGLSRTFYFFLYYILTWAFVILKLTHRRISRLGKFWSALWKNELIDVEAVLIIALAVTIPGALGLLYGESFFSAIQRWIALVFILANLPFVTRAFRFPSVRDIPLRNLGLAALLACYLFLAMPIEYVEPVRNFLIYNRHLRTEYTDKQEGQSRLANFLSALRSGDFRSTVVELRTSIIPFLTSHHKYVRSDPSNQIVFTLEELGRLSLEDKRRSLLYIPKTNRDYWDLMVICHGKPYLAPAITGIAMLYGFPESTCEERLDYGYTDYLGVERKEPPASDHVLLCEEAEALGYTSIYIITSHKMGENITEHVDCTKVE